MKSGKNKYIIIEDDTNVWHNISHRMLPYEQWQHFASFDNCEDSIACLIAQQPRLIFLDWDLPDGNAFMILDAIDKIANYQPFIIFFTAHGRERPDIAEQLFNKYKTAIHHFINKPIYEQLTANLENWIRTFERQLKQRERIFDLKCVYGQQTKINIDYLFKVLIDETNPRNKLLFFADKQEPIAIKKTWQECYEMLAVYNIEYTIANHRSTTIIDAFINSKAKPFVTLDNNERYEVVKDNWKW